MAEVKHPVRHTSQNEHVIERAKDFWTKYGKTATIVVILPYFVQKSLARSMTSSFCGV